MPGPSPAARGRIGRRPVRPVAVAAAALVLLVLAAGPAAADPAGPTDYRTEIVSVEPPVPDLGLEVIGGDSFLHLTAPAGTVVTVRGYVGEPYLRFEADGTVWQNERSPTRWQNDDRFGRSTVPDGAGPDAQPEWVTVATDGSYAWHDHRTHWMNPERPPGKGPGDTVLEAVVPLTVDGEEVAVHVRSTLLAAPTAAPSVLGAALAVMGVVAAWFVSGRRLTTSGLAMVVALGAAAAAGLGLWARFSVPPETGPSLLLWIPPPLALISAVVVATGRAAAGSWRRAPRARAPDAAALLLIFAGAELALWAWIRREALVRAMIPSDAPPVLDRAVIAGAGLLGVVAIVYPLATRLRIRAPGPSPRSAR